MTRKTVAVNPQTWARVKYQAEIKKKTIPEMLELLLTHALTDYEMRGRL